MQDASRKLREGTLARLIYSSALARMLGVLKKPVGASIAGPVFGLALCGLVLSVFLLSRPVPPQQQGEDSSFGAAAVATPEQPAALHPEPSTVPVTAEPVPPQAAAKPAVSQPANTPRVRVHTVEPGDTLRSVAERYGVTLRTLLGANELANPDLLVAGQQITVPAADGVLHTLQPGETLRAVAERYGVATGDVVAANGLEQNPDLVAAGTLLLVPGAQPDVRSPSADSLAQQPSPTTTSETQQVAAQVASPTTLPEHAAEGPALRSLPAAPRRIADTPPPPVTARYIAIMDEGSGEVLYGQGEHTPVAPASVTKMATTLVALERAADLSRRISPTISGSAMAARDGSSIMGLEPGKQVSLMTLLYGMMLPSGNDAAEQIALSLGGSRGQYVAWMNELAAEIGMRNTRFMNPSGMDAPGHASTAYDMALLGRAAMRNETFRRMAGATTYQADGYRMNNLNRLVGSYPGADGIKIGSTPAAGRTIVASATRDGRRVYVSLLRSQDLVGDSTALFNWVWRTFQW